MSTDHPRSRSVVFPSKRHHRIAALVAAAGASGLLGACTCPPRHDGGCAPAPPAPACVRGGTTPVTSWSKSRFGLACGRSKCGPPAPTVEESVALAGTDCDDAEAAAARDRLEALLSTPREFPQLCWWEHGGKGWEMTIERKDLAAARALALADPLVRPYVYRDR